MRVFFSRIVALFFLLVFSLNALSQGVDGKNLRWIVSWAPGGGADVMARIVAVGLGEKADKTVIVENKPGAGSIIGMQALIGTAPDGATVATADAGTLAFNPFLYDKLPYQPEKDFTYIGGLTRIPYVLVTKPGLNVRTAKELVDLAKANPGKLTYGSAGTGSPHHIAMEMFKQKMGIDLIHVPYKGGAPAVNDLMAGQIDLMLLDTAGGLQFMKAGKVNMLATPSAERLAQLPDVPTMKEQGIKDFEAFIWQGLVAPAGLSSEIAKTLENSLISALALPKVKDRLEDLGVQAMPMTGDDFRKYALDQKNIWGNIIKSVGIKIN